MANPRQRRKLKSKTYQKVRTQRADKLKKHPPIRGPKAIQDAWDRHKTVRQNYQALGLAASLATTTSGGVEQTSQVGAGSPVSSSFPEPGATSLQATNMTVQDKSPLIVTNTNTNGLRRGFGRIVRDEDGNVIRVELPDSVEDSGPMENSIDSPWKGPTPMSGDASVSAPTSNASKTQKTELIEELENLANRKLITPRYASQHELAWLRSLVEIHGEDIDRMARDRRLNVWQKTAGELRRAITKAGGIEKLRS